MSKDKWKDILHRGPKHPPRETKQFSLNGAATRDHHANNPKYLQWVEDYRRDINALREKKIVEGKARGARFWTDVFPKRLETIQPKVIEEEEPKSNLRDMRDFDLE